MTIPGLWHEAWAAAAVNHLWQSTVVAGVAWLLTLALRKNQARTRYWVWMAASVKFLVPFAAFVAAGAWLRSLVPARPVAQPAFAAVMQGLAQPLAETETFNAAGASVAAHSADFLPLVLVAVWVLGAAVVLARWIRGWMSVRAAMRGVRAIEIEADVPAFAVSAAMEPGIFGIFRPVLLLPEGILSRLTRAQLDAIVAHEMCHVRRRDNLTFALHMIVEAAFWFYPPVWWIGARLIEERERACDEAVVQQGGSAESYAEGILNVCRFCVESPLACAAGVTGADLKMRIVQIMTGTAVCRLTMTKKLLLAVLATSVVAAPVAFGLMQEPLPAGQILHASGPLPSFEVAAIKPDHSGSGHGRIGAAGMSAPMDRFIVTNFTIKDLIRWAWAGKSVSLPDDQVSGGPSWINSEHYDIDAKLEEPQAAAMAKLSPPDRTVQVRLMVQSLLADRFKLVVNDTTVTRPIYALVIAKDGPKLQETVPGSPSQGFGSRGEIRAHGMPITLLVRFLSQEGVGRPVLDETGLKGKYDIDLKWNPDLSSPDMMPGPSSSTESAPADTSGPSIFTALQEQLGLKLKATKGPVEDLVIMHIDHPTAN